MIVHFDRKTAAAPLLLEKTTMLGWAITFLVIALIAGLLGFSGIAGGATQIAIIIAVVAVILFIVSFILNMTRKT